jgi:ribose transport system substrate-binding protein
VEVQNRQNLNLQKSGRSKGKLVKFQKTKVVKRFGASVLGVVALLGASISAPSESFAAKQKTVGLIIFNGTDAFVQSVAKGVNESAAANGWKVKSVDVAGKVDAANTAIQNFVSAKVDAIITTAVSSASLKSGLAQAKRAKIPVISEDGGLASGISATVLNVNDASNAAPIQAMANAMGGSGKVLAFTYKPGLPCLLRENSLDSVLGNYPNIEVTKYALPDNGHAQAAATAAASWLQTNSTYTGNMAVWACYDDPAVGAISSIASTNKKVLVYGYNGSPNALQAISKGTMTASVYFDPLEVGKKTFTALLAAVKAGTKAAPQTVNGPFMLITKANVSTVLK